MCVVVGSGGDSVVGVRSFVSVNVFILVYILFLQTRFYVHNIVDQNVGIAYVQVV